MVVSTTKYGADYRWYLERSRSGTTPRMLWGNNLSRAARMPLEEAVAAVMELREEWDAAGATGWVLSIDEVES